MITLKFGLPGCGKTTFMIHDIFKAIKSKRYENIYCNVRSVTVPGVIYVTNDCIGKYELKNCALFIDEATLFADSRDHKNFDKGKLEYFLEHRHRNADIFLYTQQWDGVDRKIRVITDRVYYIYKGVFTRAFISSSYRIPYGIIIPDPNNGNEKLGEIIQGYSKPPWYIRLFFAERIFRPKYYKYFDSWELKELPPLPSIYKPYCPIPGTDSKSLFCCVKDKIAEIRAKAKDRILISIEILKALPASFRNKGKYQKK